MCCMCWHAHFHVGFKSWGITTTKKKVIFSSFIFKSLLVAALYPFFSSHLTVCLGRERIKVKHVILLLLSCILRGLRLSAGLWNTNHGMGIFLAMGHPFQNWLFFNVLLFVCSWFQNKFGGLCAVMAILGLTECPFGAHSVHARSLHCHVIPPSYRGRRDKPWGKGTQTIPCFFKMGSIKRRLLICSSGSDLISGDCRAEMVSLLWVCKHQRSSDPAEEAGNVCGQVLALLICAVGIGTSLRVSKQSVKLWRKWIF